MGGEQDNSRAAMDAGPIRLELSRTLVRAARTRNAYLTVGELIGNLGDRSFGWCLLVFALLNLLPMPTAATLITAVPLIVLTAQMAFGWHRVHLPDFISRRRVDSASFRRVALRLQPTMKRLERFLKPRYLGVFATGRYRLLGAMLLAVSLALFLPVPLSGFLSAGAVALVAIGLITHDGLVALAGLALGATALVFTTGIGFAIVVGARALF